MNREYYINTIADKLLWLCNYIDMQKSAGFYDILRYSEDFFCGLLNLVYDFDLQVTNRKNISGPDLLDIEKHIAVDITVSTTKQKIVSIINRFERTHYFDEEYRLIILLLVSQKPVSLVHRLQASNRTLFKWFDVGKDLLDITDISNYVKILPAQELLKVYQYVCDAPIFQNQKQAEDGITLRKLTNAEPLKSLIIGRTDEISSVETQLKTNNILLISGDAGIGKTTIASHLYYKWEKSVDHIGWIRSLGNLEKDLLQLNIFEELQSDSLRLSSITKWLSSGSKKTCIFIDDYSNMLSTDEEAFLHALPKNISIIFISRLNSLSSNLKIGTIVIGPLDIVNSRRLFDHYYMHETDTQTEDKIQARLKETDGNPLLIELMSRSLNNSSFLLKKGSIKDFNVEIFKEFFEQLDFTQEEKRILCLLFIMPEQLEIWSSFFEWAEFDKNAVTRLLNLGLINFFDPYYVMPPLVRAVLKEVGAEREYLSFNNNDYEQLIIKLNETDSYLEDCQSEKDSEKRLNFITALCAYIIKNDFFDNKMALLLIRIARILKERNSLEEALEYYTYFVQKCELLKGTCDSMLAKGYLGIADIFCLLSEYYAAMSFIEKAQVLIDSSEINKLQAGELYYDLGCIFVEMREIDKGEEYIRKAGCLIDYDTNDNNKIAEEIYCALANIFSMRGDNLRALEMYDRANKMNEQASTLNSMALCYHELERFEEAFPFYLKAYGATIKRYGPDHPATVVVKNNFRCLLQEDLSLKHVIFASTEMIEFDFSALSLQGAVLRSQLVKNCSFFGADLRNADFTNSQLEDDVFSRADLSKANFESTIVKMCTFLEADLYRVVFDESRLVDIVFRTANLKNVSFKGADFAKVDFKSTHLKRCTFEGAHLYDVTFEGSRMEDIVFKDAYLKNVSFIGAEMKNVVLDAAYLENVMLPKSLNKRFTGVL